MLDITDPRITETINSSDFNYDFAEVEKANYEEHKALYANNPAMLADTEKQHELWQHANPYEKALALVQPHALDNGIPYLRHWYGTDWKWDEPVALKAADDAGLNDPTLVKVTPDAYVFEDHSDRFACMSDDFRAHDAITTVTLPRNA
jgi:hypothetical protein